MNRPSANIIALGVGRPRGEEEEEMQEHMLPPEFEEGSVVPGMMPGQMQDPMAPRDYGMPSQEDPMRLAGRVFTPGVGWSKGPRST